MTLVSLTSKPSPLLKLDQVTLKTRQGAHYLLQDISLALTPGERIGLVGASGAGKTSLFRLLNRLESPSSGTLSWENLNYTEISAIKLRQQVTLVLQESSLLEMTVAEAITYPLRLRGVPAPTIQARLTEWTERLRIPSDWLHRTELQLSVGQRQWVALARALVMEPKVLLLDEPTSALDSGKAHHLIEILKEMSETSMTILMINHQLDVMKTFAQRVLQLERGQLIQDTPAAEMDWEGLRSSLAWKTVEDQQEWHQ